MARRFWIRTEAIFIAKSFWRVLIKKELNIYLSVLCAVGGSGSIRKRYFMQDKRGARGAAADGFLLSCSFRNALVYGPGRPERGAGIRFKWQDWLSNQTRAFSGRS
jgi:hypothetical protein